MTKYAFVSDANGKKLSPTKERKAWFLIRKKRAILINKYPMTIQLNKKIDNDDVCKDEIRCGIDDGGLHVGIALIQKGKIQNKLIFKGTIEQRNDVHYLMKTRGDRRRFRRYHKRYRQVRFDNRSSSKRFDRIAPTILQKRQAIIRIINALNKWINITSYWLEDVSLDVRALTDGYKSYKWEYCVSNRLDENIRKAVLLRDNFTCMECGKFKCRLEVHHIKPRRLNGSNTLDNLITLCKSCHQKTEGKEDSYMDKYFHMLNSSDKKGLNYAQHVMIGKKWLRKQISNFGILHLTNGGDTANKRIDWNIEKSHSNDAICTTDLQPNTVDIKDWIIKPIRKKSKGKKDAILGISYRDFVEYTFKNGETYRGYVTALYPKQAALNFQSQTKHCKKVSAHKCRLLWKFSKIYWL